MNERIKELMEQAGCNVMGIWNVIGIGEYHEKFARLIVRECIEYCGENLSKTVAAALKIHFGVKE